MTNVPLLRCELPLLLAPASMSRRETAARFNMTAQQVKEAMRGRRRRLASLGIDPSIIKGRPVKTQTFVNCRGKTVAELAQVIDVNELRHWKD